MEREEIFRLKCHNGRNALVLAKTLKAMSAEAELAAAFASVALNRFIYESEIDGEASFVQVVAGGVLFSCWRNARAMDLVEPGAELVAFASAALKGEVADITLGSRRFVKEGASEIWTTGLKPAARIGGYLFYNNCD
ncbi:MAG: hypothetical protein LBL52_03610 [Rickettsiales bacterium]|jgi:hypothetical protein|nr:hypothetical protein [Rickettsiales bacterium]